MFTRIAKGILTLGMIISFIASIIIGVFIGDKSHNGLAGFGIVILGGVLTVVTFTGFGVIVEIATNIEVIRKEMEKRQTYPVQANSNTSKSTGNSYNLIEMYNNRWNCPFCGHQNLGDAAFCTKCGKNKSDSPTPESDFWTCRHCGTKNNMRDRYCKSCRQDKLSAPSPTSIPPSQQDDYWKCPQCGEINSVFSYACKKCGNSKY